jgi:hypothetical protein
MGLGLGMEREWAPSDIRSRPIALESRVAPNHSSIPTPIPSPSPLAKENGELSPAVLSKFAVFRKLTSSSSLRPLLPLGLLALLL